MADIREKEQQQNTDFEKNYIDENIKADQDLSLIHISEPTRRS